MAGATRDQGGAGIGGPAEERVRVYLRAPLFTTRADPHLPPGTFVVEGWLRPGRGPSGGLVVAVGRCLDEGGRPLAPAAAGAPVLFLPFAKIDHVSFLDAGATGDTGDRGSP